MIFPTREAFKTIYRLVGRKIYRVRRCKQSFYFWHIALCSLFRTLGGYGLTMREILYVSFFFRISMFRIFKDDIVGLILDQETSDNWDLIMYDFFFLILLDFSVWII